VGQVDWRGIAVRKLLIASEPGVELPALLLRPPAVRHAEVILHAAEAGKPTSLDEDALPLELATLGYPVLSVDVRGVGEADPSPQPPPGPFDGYDPAQWRRDATALKATCAGTTMLALQASDLSRTLDWLQTQPDLAGKSTIAVGEGLGGVWAMVAAAFDDRITAVTCRQTVVSYASVIETQYYAVRSCFWVPGAVRDYDLPDLPALIAPRPVLWLDTVDAALQPLDAGQARAPLAWSQSIYAALGRGGRLSVAHTQNPADAREAAETLSRLLQAPH